MFDHNEILARIKTSPEGTPIVYHRGLLAKDKGPMNFNEKNDKEKELAFFAHQVYEAYLNGFCVLTQKKLANNIYDYIATTSPQDGRAERSIKNRQLHDSSHGCDRS